MIGFHHVGLATRDLDRLEWFYVDLFGAVPIRRVSWEQGSEEFDKRIGLNGSTGRLVLLDCGAARLELFEFTEPVLDTVAEPSVARPGLTHLAFEVDDIDAEYARLKGAGVRFNAPPLKMPSGGQFTYGRDPDGNLVEIVQPPKAP